jgi:hypothetical protein
LAVRPDDPIVVVSLELAPIVVEEPDEEVPLWAVDDGEVVLPELLPAVSVEGVVEALPLAVPPVAVPGVAVEPVAAPAAGAVLEVPPVPAAVVPLVPEDVWAQARPKVPAMAAAMTVMLSVR